MGDRAAAKTYTTLLWETRMWGNASRDSSLGMADRRRGRRSAWATRCSSSWRYSPKPVADP
jgi:hypothetical protein